MDRTSEFKHSGNEAGGGHTKPGCGTWRDVDGLGPWSVGYCRGGRCCVLAIHRGSVLNYRTQSKSAIVPRCQRVVGSIQVATRGNIDRGLQSAFQ
jgi:hypothetical protein